jgi:hypothetical protein
MGPKTPLEAPKPGYEGAKAPFDGLSGRVCARATHERRVASRTGSSATGEADDGDSNPRPSAWQGTSARRQRATDDDKPARFLRSQACAPSRDDTSRRARLTQRLTRGCFGGEGGCPSKGNRPSPARRHHRGIPYRAPVEEQRRPMLLDVAGAAAN